MSEADTSETEEAAEAAPEPDALREGLIGKLGDRLGEGLVDSHILPGLDVWARVNTDAWTEAAAAASDALGCRYFCYLSAIDWMPSPWGRYEDAQVDDPFPPVEYPRDYEEVPHGVCGGATRFQVFARIYNTDDKYGITLKADVPDDTLAVGTWINTYGGAAWHEREASEMFGLVFMGNPDLRNLYLPTEFEGYPLRKDFPLLARQVKPWPGLVDVEPMPAEPGADDADAAPSSETEASTDTVEEEAAS